MISTKKLLLSVSAMAAAAVTLAGCTTTTASTPATAGDASGGLSIEMVVNNQFSPFYVTMARGAETEAKKLGVRFSWQGPQEENAANQTSLLQSIASKKPSGIIFSAADSNALAAPLKQVFTGGIPVITVDSDVSEKSARLFTITSDGALAGTTAAAEVDKLLDGKGEVGYVGYTPGVAAIDTKHDSWKSALKKYPGLKDVGDQFAAIDQSDNVTKASALIAAHPNLKAIFTTWDGACSGAAQAVKQAGKSSSIKVVCMDATQAQADLVRQGEVAALIAQKPAEMGKKAVDDLVAYIKDKKTGSDELVGYTVVTKENIEGDGKAALYDAVSK